MSLEAQSQWQMEHFGHDDLPASPFKVGNKVIIETVMKYFCGVIVGIGQYEIILEDVSWVVNSGRPWSLAEGVQSAEAATRYEPYGKGIRLSINRYCVTVVYNWVGDLPTQAK